VTPLRAVNLLAALAATVAALLLARPGVFALTGGTGLVLFVVGAGSMAADAFPWRRLAFWCSLATVACGVLLALVQVTGLPPLIFAAAAVALQLAPLAEGKLRT
jgi:hypothetical protein